MQSRDSTGLLSIIIFTTASVLTVFISYAVPFIIIIVITF